MENLDTLLIISPQTNFEETEFIRKDALQDWIKAKLSNEQGFASDEAEYGYKEALKELAKQLKKI